MAKTAEQDSKPVRINAKMVEFLEELKKTKGPVRFQIETILRNDLEFMKAFTAYTRKGG